MSFSAELQFLVEDKEVPASVIEKMKEFGMATLSRLVLAADDRAGMRAIFKDEFKLDPAALPANRLGLIAFIDAWESAHDAPRARLD